MHERELWSRGRSTIAGLDEVGTGAWAGPVVAGCVVWSSDVLEGGADEANLIHDSKRLSPKRRQALNGWIRERALAVGLGWVQVSEIAALNVLRASLLAMERALAEAEAMLGRSRPVEHLLTDARSLPSFRGDQTALVGGDGLSASIGAASIVAKVARDAFMVEAAERHPGYGFEVHKGYGTAAHRAALASVGPCELHRMSFLPTASGQLPLW